MTQRAHRAVRPPSGDQEAPVCRCAARSRVDASCGALAECPRSVGASTSAERAAPTTLEAGLSPPRVMTDRTGREPSAFRLNLEQQKNRAKDLLHAARGGDA